MGDIDRYLETLFDGKLITENEVKDLCEKVIEILDNYNGNTECRIRCSKQNQTFMFKHPVNANNLLLYELQTVLKEEDIKLV